jgi:hypothetical protein
VLGRWSVRGCGAPDLAVVDGLARLQLTASRLGGDVELSDVTAALDELLELVGLLGQMRRQVEDREEPVGVEERVDPGDPAG